MNNMVGQRVYQTTYDAKIAELTTYISDKADAFSNYMMAQPVSDQPGMTYWDTVPFRSAALLDSSGNQYTICLVREAKVQALEALITQL